MPEILTSIEGGKFGLTPRGGLLLNQQRGGAFLIGETAHVTIAAANVTSLFGTPITVIPAQGANIAIIPLMWNIYKFPGSAFAGIAAGEDMVLKYTDASGAQISSVIEATGFLDATVGVTRHAFAPASTGATAGSYLPAANEPVVVHMLTGDVTGGSNIQVRVWYTTISTLRWLD